MILCVWRRLSLILVAALCVPVSTAMALDPPAPQNLMDWIGGNSLAELLGAEPAAPVYSPATDTSAVQIHFLVNQCTPDLEPPVDLFAVPTRLAEMMSVAPTPALQTEPVQIDLQEPSAVEFSPVAVECAAVPLPQPRPSRVEPIEVATLPFQPLSEPVQITAPIPAPAPVRQPEAPPAQLQTSVHASGSFITFAVSAEPAPTSSTNDTTQLSPSITLLR